MNNKIFAMVAALLMVLTMVTPALADMGSVSTVNNVAPVIDCDSFAMEIASSTGDLLWDGAGNGVRGALADPYMVDGETLSFTVDVSDTNGESDLETTGTIAVGFFRSTADETDWSNAELVYKLGVDRATMGDSDINEVTFIADKILNEGLDGEYVVYVGASDSFSENPETDGWFFFGDYADDQCLVATIYMNPLTGLTIVDGNDNTFANINFGAQDPGTTDVLAEQNTIKVTNSGDFGAIQDILVRTDDMTKAGIYLGNSIIPAGNMFLTSQGVSAGIDMGNFDMSTEEQPGAKNVPNGDNWMFDLDLDFPATLADGAYEGQFIIIAELL